MASSKTKHKRTPKSILKLPDLEQSKSAVLNSLTSPSSQRTYDHAIREFIEWYCSEPRLAFNKTVVTRYRISLEQRHYASTTINLRLAAVRRLAYEAADCGLLSADLAAGIRRVKGAKRLGVPVGNWLTVEQGKRLLLKANEASIRGKRDYATLAILLGCGLRRGELTALRVEDIQQREEHWVIADLVGKGGHIRTIPVPDWVKAGIDAWTGASGITTGTLLRSINKAGRVWGTGFSPKVIWGVVKQKAKDCEIRSLAPHDLRRTCARLCHQAGGELEQIQFLLGHVSVQTTERYLDCKQRFRNAVNVGSGWNPIGRNLRRFHPLADLWGVIPASMSELVICSLNRKTTKNQKPQTFGLPMSIPLRNHWKSSFDLRGQPLSIG
jgi:integrase